MPTAKQVSWAKIRIAIMMGASMAILSILVYLLLGGTEFLQPKAEVRTCMIDSSGLAKGSPVRFNGIRIGEVTDVRLSHLPDPQKVVCVEMALVQKYLQAIPEDSIVAVDADNVLGDKFVNITEGKSPRHLRSGGELASPPPKEIDKADLIRAARQIVARFDSLLGDIEAGRGELGKFVKGDQMYQKILTKIGTFQQELRAATARNAPIGRYLYSDTFYEELRAPIRRLNDTLASIGAGQGAGGEFLKDSAQYDRLRKSVGDLNRTLEDWNAGKGPAGKILKDDEQYRRMQAMVENLNTQVDALNAGSGPLGNLLTDSSLYESLHGSTSRLHNMLKELRENPQKFLRVKLF